jgi:hypothetical protein
VADGSRSRQLRDPPCQRPDQEPALFLGGPHPEDLSGHRTERRPEDRRRDRPIAST